MTGGTDSYDETREAAFRRDNHTCGLCGKVGYPKTEHGLAAVPVEPDDYRLENLVTVCHNCLKKDDQELRDEIREAFQRRQRRSNNRRTSAQETNSASETRKSEKEPKRSSGRIKTAVDTLREKTRHLNSAGYDEDRSDEFELVDQVGKRDNFHCQVCGSITQPRGNVGYIIYSVENREGEPSTDNQITVCMDCIDWEDERTIEREVRKSAQLKFAEPNASALYAKSVLRNLKEKTRLLVHSGRLVVLRRAFASAIGILSLLTVGILLAGILGALFVSPQSGLKWIPATFHLYQAANTSLLPEPWLGLAILGGGYLAHVFKQERAYKRELYRDQRRRGDTLTVSHARPRWQFVAGFATVGVFGAIDWILVRHGILPSGMLFGALVLWSLGSVGVAHYLRDALREDRDIDGLLVTPAPWVFAARYALFVGLIGAGTTLLATSSFLATPIIDLAALTAPLVGGLYVLRRYVERRTVWGARLMQRLRTTCDRLWPWDDQWPPQPQSEHRQQTTTTDSTTARHTPDDSHEQP